MQIKFLGGAKTVTGSCYMLTVNGARLLVDMGMFQGKHELEERNRLELFDHSKIDYILLTHAHIDHSGLIPKLVKNGFSGKIITTKATMDLAKIMLMDSAHVHSMELEWQNRKRKRANLPILESLYTADDAELCINFFTPIEYGKILKIDDLEIRFSDAGHILGSSIIEIWYKSNGNKKKIVFSGDLGQEKKRILNDPEKISDADVIFIESTYGSRLHKVREDTLKELKQAISYGIERGGNIVIPAFAVERTQEILYELNELFKNNILSNIPVYLDSPLAISATEIFKNNVDYFDDETKKLILKGDNPFDFPELICTVSAEESKKINDAVGGAVIISASGMCDAGRIKHHLKHNLWREESVIIIVGFQAEGTLGRAIVDGAKKVHIFGEEIAVNAKVFTIGGFSGHADQNGLINWVSNFKNTPKKIIVVHGEETQSNSLADKIKEKFNVNAIIPDWLDTIEV